MVDEKTRTARKQQLGVAALVLFLLGCGASLRVPNEQDLRWAQASWPGTTLAELQAGRKEYVSRCAGCHALHLPGEHGPGEWPRHVERMAQKALLSEAQRDLIVKYLSAASAAPVISPAP